MKESITQKTITEVLKRSKGRCEQCDNNNTSAPHHIFFKSSYFKDDRNMSWNLADICEKCHRIIHHAGSDSEIILKIKYDYKLKNNAVKRYHGKYKKELENLIKLVKFKYDNIKRNSTID